MFSDTDGICNAYITCASTGKAAVAIDGCTVHTALKISLSKLLPLSTEVIHQFRALFKYVKVLLIDEISMIGAELLMQIDCRLKQITGNFNTNFGGIDIILIGDLRQLPPVRATAIYKQPKQRMAGPTLWRGLKFHELTQVMRQSDTQFSSILTKIGSGELLNETEISLIESRFFSKSDANTLCPNGIRLFLTNNAMTQYNNSILQNSENKVISIAQDAITGSQNAEQLAFLRQKLHKLSTIETGGLPYEIVFVFHKPYIITTNIDVTDGLANGAVGDLVHLEYDNENKLIRVWLEFPTSPKVGLELRKKSAAHATNRNISLLAVPINLRTSCTSLNNNRTIFAKRKHFPLIAACAMTIHKSQGGTFNEVVYEYEKQHCQQLVYVAFSRVTSLGGIYIVNPQDNKKFYHGRKRESSMIPLQQELQRLSLNRLETINHTLIDFISESPCISFYSLNCQGLQSHVQDLTDQICSKCHFLVLSETNMKNSSHIDIPNFKCVIKFKRENVRSGGVAIYSNESTSTNTIIPYINIHSQTISSSNESSSQVGDICFAQSSSSGGQEFIILATYISPNTNINTVIEFLQFHLLPFTNAGAQLLNKNYNVVPLILSGDFNINFAHQSAHPLIEFLLNKLNLNMNNNRNQATTKSGTTIDAIFTRYLNFSSKMFISYFSYHNPIITVLNE